MPTVLQHRRGTTTQNNSFTGAVGELAIDTTLNVVVVQDGTTAGGFPQVNTTSTQTVYNKTFPVISGVTVYSGNLVANSATASTSTTTGALVVVGGIGVSGNIFLSGNVVGNGNGAWTIPVGTSVQRPGLASQGMIRYNSTISSFEGYGAGSAWSSLGGVKSVDGFATITAEASAGASDDVLRFYSGSTGSSVQVMWASAGNISILPSTTSTSTTTGALQVTGGISTQGNLYVGGNLVVTGTQTFLNTETLTATEYATTINATNLYASTIGNTGATLTGTLSTATQNSVTTMTGLTSFGTAGVTTTAAGNFTITGCLTVNGTTTTINNTTVETTEYVSTIDATTVRATTLGNTGATLTGTLSTASQPNITTLAGVTSIGASGSTTLTGTLSTASQPNITTLAGVTSIGASGSTTLTGILQTAAQTNITSVGTLTGLTVSGAIVPNANATVNLGSTSAYWNALYSASATHNSITVGGQGILPAANVAVNIGSSSSWFNNIYGTAIHAAYADLAENYTADAEYAPGTVVVFGGDKEITVTTTSHDTRVAGVISTDPAYLMNGATVGLPVAMTGRVPCQVQGPVTKGQVLVTSATAGVAEAIDNTRFLPGCIVGKALGAINTNSIETIEVVVGRF